MRQPFKVRRRVRNTDPNRIKTESELATEEAEARLSIFDREVLDVRVVIGHDSRTAVDIRECRSLDNIPNNKWARKTGKIDD
jgi:hypothetical protein